MKKYIVLLSLFIITILISNSCYSRKDISSDNKDRQKPQNVILMIGDGMSTPHIYAAMLTLDSPSAFEKFPIVGLVKTHSKSNKITDSAAGGTAIATGHKTNNGIIGMNHDSIPVPSILEILSKKEKKTGMVVTSYITHATPASFIAKNVDRNNYEEIAEYISESESVNLLIGGGRKHFTDRKDGYNLIDKMIEKGWSYYDTIIYDTKGDRIIILADDKHLPSYPIRGNFLPDATSLALEKLENENGFFLMVEGSQIDFAGHDKDSTYLINEMSDFNNTINRALEFADKNQNTLVIVTADHETGGLTIIDPEENYRKTNFHFSTGSHTPLLVPIFAYGPGSENFSGIMDNTEIMRKILETIDMTSTNSMY